MPSGTPVTSLGLAVAIDLKSLSPDAACSPMRVSSSSRPRPRGGADQAEQRAEVSFHPLRGRDEDRYFISTLSARRMPLCIFQPTVTLSPFLKLAGVTDGASLNSLPVDSFSMRVPGA